MNTNPTFERTTLVTMRAPMGCRRVRRGMAMLRLLVLSALCGWAWSAAKAAKAQTGLVHSSILAHSSFLSSSMPEMPEMVELKTEKGRTENGWTIGEALTMSGAVLLLVLVLALAVRRQASEDAGSVDDDPYAGDGREDPMRVMLRRYGIAVVTTVDLQLLRDLALSEQGITAVDRFVRWRWKKVLFMTSLMEIVALAGKLSQTVRRGDKETIRQSDTETERKEDAARWTVGPLESLGEADCIDRDDRSDGFQVSKSHGLPVSKSPTEGRAAA